jgi:thiol-disulfide isomerase/thioredoxin
MGGLPLEAGPPARPGRRGVVGPFTARQLVVVAAVVVASAVGLVAVTRPLGTIGTGPGVAPAPTAYIVGPVVQGLAPGQEAPEFEVTLDDGTVVGLTGLDGDPIRLEDLRGRLVWLNFWASWCPPCQFETPILREMDEAYRDRGLTIVGAAVQETTVDDVRRYGERYELDYPIAFDTNADIFHLYRVFALPTQFFIGPDGVVREVVNGPLTTDAAMARIEAWLPAAASPSPSSTS